MIPHLLINIFTDNSFTRSPTEEDSQEVIYITAVTRV